MFRACIDETPFSTDVADVLFPHITGEAWHGDMVFLSTLRALAAPRIGDGRLDLEFNSTSNLDGLADVVREIPPNKLFVVELPTDEEEFYQRLSTTIPEASPEWGFVPNITKFYRKAFKAAGFINTAIKSAVVFTEQLDMRRMHYLQCAIVSLLPWIFTPENKITPEELNLLKSLRENTPDEYNRLLAGFASRYDFRSAGIRAKLAGFETRADRLQLESKKSNMETFRRRIDEYNERIRHELQNMHDTEIQILGLKAKIERNSGEGGELMEYFLANSFLTLEETNDNTIVFDARGYLEYFDTDYAAACIDNENSDLYRRLPSDISRIDAANLFRKIFIDREIRIRFCAGYSFDLRGEVRGLDHHSFGYECSGYMPNPHIHYHHCLGDYRPAINELLEQREYIGAIEQCTASARSLNLHDGVVTDEFIRDFYKETTPAFIELPDGKVVTTRDAVKYLKTQEEA